MQSLIDRGLDPLTVLIDRAHDKGMDFIASLRMTSYLGLDASQKVPDGRGLANKEQRDHQAAVLKELTHDYNTDGIEMDFALAPGGGPYPLRKEDVKEYTPVLTDWVREISQSVRNRPGGKPGVVGARIYPTEEMNLAAGYDVRTWIKEGLVDYVCPMFYPYFILDPDMPIDWVVDAARGTDVAVYGMLQPYIEAESVGNPERIFPTAEQMRAGAASLWSRGVDGLYTYFMRWPLGDTERRILTELDDADLIAELDKHYMISERAEDAREHGYDRVVPLKIESADGVKRSIPFRIADDIEGREHRIRQVILRINVDNLMGGDDFTVLLNGKSLAGEICLKNYGSEIGVYTGQKLEFHLKGVLPKKGDNVLEVSLNKRPANMVGGVTVHDVEVYVQYGPYPSGPG